jgi:hypothetical protein
MLLPCPCHREWSYLRLTLRIRKLAKLDPCAASDGRHLVAGLEVR